MPENLALCGFRPRSLRLARYVGQRATIHEDVLDHAHALEDAHLGEAGFVGSALIGAVGRLGLGRFGVRIAGGPGVGADGHLGKAWPGQCCKMEDTRD